MRTLVIVLLVVALALQLVAIPLVSRSDLAIDTDGTPYLRLTEPRHVRIKRVGGALALSGVVVATVASLLSELT